MKTLFARIAGPSRRTRALLAAAAVVLVVLAGGIALGLSAELRSRVLGGLAGAAVLTGACGADADCPPAWDPGQPNVYTMSPLHAVAGGSLMFLAEERTLNCATNWVSIWPWDANSPANRQWIFVPVAGTTYFRIFNNADKIISEPDLGRETECYRYLAIMNDATNAGADVIVFPDAGGANHQWLLHKVKDGGDANQAMFVIESVSVPGMCLDIRGQSAASGSRLEIQPCSDVRFSQAFTLTRQ